MNITVTGRKMQVTDALHDYAIEKIEGACKVFDTDPMTAEVVLHVEKNPANPKSAIAEVTIHSRGHIIRAEEAEEDMYAAIDLAADKTQRQLRKYKTKIVDRRTRERGVEVTGVATDLPPVTFEDDEAIVRVKEVDLLPLTQDEALIEIDLLGHDFFLYTDALTGLVNVIYRRGAGGYGILKPKGEAE